MKKLDKGNKIHLHSTHISNSHRMMMIAKKEGKKMKEMMKKNFSSDTMGRNM